MDITTFRTDFSEFADSTKYPDSLITFWMNVAVMLLRADRWQDSLDLATELFIAHHVVLEKFNLDTVNAGGWPGLNTGVVSSESPGGVSISYDTSSILELDAGHWNYTVFGTRFIRLARMFGSGPIQIGAGCSDGIGAWQGPVTGFPWYY